MGGAEDQESEPHVCGLMKTQNAVEEGDGGGRGKGRFGSDGRVIGALRNIFIGQAIFESNVCKSDNCFGQVAPKKKVSASKSNRGFKLY